MLKFEEKSVAKRLMYSITNIGLVPVVCFLVMEHVQYYAVSCDKRLVGVAVGDMRLYMNLFLRHEVNVISNCMVAEVAVELESPFLQFHL